MKESSRGDFRLMRAPQPRRCVGQDSNLGTPARTDLESVAVGRAWLPTHRAPRPGVRLKVGGHRHEALTPTEDLDADAVPRGVAVPFRVPHGRELLRLAVAVRVERARDDLSAPWRELDLAAPAGPDPRCGRVEEARGGVRKHAIHPDFHALRLLSRGPGVSGDPPSNRINRPPFRGGP